MSDGSATSVSIAAGPLVGPVLRRVVGMLAARADLPLDRLDDAVLVADRATILGTALEIRTERAVTGLSMQWARATTA